MSNLRSQAASTTRHLRGPQEAEAGIAKRAMQQIVRPTENEIATDAYQLWLDSGRPIGSDREHWFRAEAMLWKALAAGCEEQPELPPIRGCDIRTSPALEAGFIWEGHWEIWEREWGARWVWGCL